VPPQTPDGKRAARELLGLPVDAHLVGNAGWLIPRKRFDVFLNVAAELSNKFENIHFLIAGDGPEKESLAQLTARLGLADRVIFMGWQADLALFYEALDVLLFNSDFDAFPTTPAEAMNHGVPVVGSSHYGGLGEILTVQTGWMHKTHDINALASSVIDAINHPNTRPARALSTIRLISDPEVIARQIEDLFLTGRSNAKDAGNGCTSSWAVTGRRTHRQSSTW
jgi:glycosyltransferase involved in cell wall biosynthesis